MGPDITTKCRSFHQVNLELKYADSDVQENGPGTP